MKHPASLFSCILALSVGFAADPPKKPPTSAEEFRRLQGTWIVEAWEDGGTALPAADLKKRSVFFGGNVFVFRHDGKVHQAGTTQLDPEESPRSINFAVKEGKGKGDAMPGIYEFKGDTLRVCFDPKGQDRPADFKPNAKSGQTLITLKKPKPLIPETIEIVGKYRSELVEATGKVVVTQAVVERRGDGYLVTYTVGDKVLFIGTALRKGDQLSMCWISAGQAGVSVYTIERGPKLIGEYTTLGGIGVTAKEVLTPWKEVD